MDNFIAMVVILGGIYGLYKWTRFINNPERLNRNIERQNMNAKYGIVEYFARRKIADCFLLVISAWIYAAFAYGHAKGIAWAFPISFNILVLYILFNILVLGKVRYNDDMMYIYNWYSLPEKIPYDNIVSAKKEKAYIPAGTSNMMDVGFDGEFLRITYLNKNKYLRELCLPYQYFVGVDLIYHKLRTEIEARHYN